MTRPGTIAHTLTLSDGKESAADRIALHRVANLRPMFPCADDPGSPARAWEVAHFYPCDATANPRAPYGREIMDLSGGRGALCGVDYTENKVLEWGVR
jgi:hypothetical protein